MKPQLLLTLLAASLVALVLPLASSARVDAGGALPMGSTAVQEADDDADEADAEDADDEDAEDDELEQEGTLTLSTDAVLVTDEHGGVTSCAVPAGVDLSAFAGQDVEVKCEQVNGVWTVVRVEAEDGETEVEVGDVDNSGPGNAEDDDEDNSGPGSVDDDSDDNSGPGNLDDGDNDDDTPSVDDSDDDHSGPGGGHDDEEDDD